MLSVTCRRERGGKHSGGTVSTAVPFWLSHISEGGAAAALYDNVTQAPRTKGGVGSSPPVSPPLFLGFLQA